jgi:hypothetical protein
MSSLLGLGDGSDDFDDDGNGVNDGIATTMTTATTTPWTPMTAQHRPDACCFAGDADPQQSVVTCR